MQRNTLLSILALVGILLLGMLGQAGVQSQNAPTASESATPSATITETPSNLPFIEMTMTAQAPLEITFDGVYSLALEFRQPLRDALAANRTLLPGLRYTVSAFRDVPGWAKITLVPTEFVENGWANVEQIMPVEVIMRFSPMDGWQGYPVGSAGFSAVLSQIPAAFVDYVSPLPPPESGYKFPWQSGQDWWAIQGWHDGNALDFQPGLNGRYAVLAAQAGRLRELCSDGTQSLLQLQHADGRSTYSLHVTLGLTVRRLLLDQNVRQGQYLGELVRQRRFVTPCGQGLSRHLHFAVSDRRMSFEGYPLEGIAASASCCANPPTYRSSNIRLDVTS